MPRRRIFQHFGQRMRHRIEDIDKLLHPVAFQEWQQAPKAIVAGFSKKIILIEQIPKVIGHSLMRDDNDIAWSTVDQVIRLGEPLIIPPSQFPVTARMRIVIKRLNADENDYQG